MKGALWRIWIAITVSVTGLVRPFHGVVVFAFKNYKGVSLPVEYKYLHSAGPRAAAVPTASTSTATRPFGTVPLNPKQAVGSNVAMLSCGILLVRQPLRVSCWLSLREALLLPLGWACGGSCRRRVDAAASSAVFLRPSRRLAANLVGRYL